MARHLGAILAVGSITALLAVMTSLQALDRYDAFQSGWSWDLAYYNQWFWALTQGDQTISVRPIAAYAIEGPSIWKANYFTPIRVVLAPIYALWPDPRVLLIIQSVVFWLIVPAAYTLVRAETRSEWPALLAALLVPLTPLLWPLAWNDFRELQLALPFLLGTIQGWRGRDWRLCALGVAGLLACRQEFAIVVASLVLLPPRDDEDLGKTYRWSRVVVLLGVGWMCGFLLYLYVTAGTMAPREFLDQFGGRGAGMGETLATASEILVEGLGPWALLALFSPRAALLAAPWLLGLSGGRWSLRFLETEDWHHVRYAAPAVGLVVAAGLLGWSRLACRIQTRRRGALILPGLGLITALGLIGALRSLERRMSLIEPPISSAEASELWSWIDRVKPFEGVLSAYEVAGPLSSRRHLSSNRLEIQQPPGFPNRLGPEIHWAFLRVGDLEQTVLTRQGFRLVHDGPFIQVYRRQESSARKPEKAAP